MLAWSWVHVVHGADHSPHTCAGCESIQTLPHSLGQLSMLAHMDLTGCTSLSWLPSAMSCLTSLQSLTVTRCSSLTELPPGIGFLSNLEVLEAGNTQEHMTIHSKSERLKSFHCTC